MANEPAFYVLIDGKWHELSDDAATVCGLATPYPNAEWTRTVPDEVHCGEHAKPKAKKK